MINTVKDAAMGIPERKMKKAETKSCQTILSCFRWFSEVCDVVGVSGMMVIDPKYIKLWRKKKTKCLHHKHVIIISLWHFVP